MKKQKDEPSMELVGFTFLAICGLALLILFLVWG